MFLKMAKLPFFFPMHFANHTLHHPFGSFRRELPQKAKALDLFLQRTEQ